MIGGITSTGTFSTTDDTVCSSNYMLCDGLRIERKTDTKTQMRVYYYDINKRYLGCSDKVRGNYVRNADFPLAGFCRIVLYPDMGEKNSDEFFVTIFDVDDIVKEFNITVNKKQDFTAVCRATLKNELEEWVDREINVYDEFFYDASLDVKAVDTFSAKSKSYDKDDYQNLLQKIKSNIFSNAIKYFQNVAIENLGELLDEEIVSVRSTTSLSSFIAIYEHITELKESTSIVDFNFIYNDRGSGKEPLGIKAIFRKESNTLVQYEISFDTGNVKRLRIDKGSYIMYRLSDSVTHISSLSAPLNFKDDYVSIDVRQDYTSIGNVLYCSSSSSVPTPDGVWTDGLTLGWDCWYDSDETTSLTASYAGFSNSSWYSIQTPLENNQVFSFSLELGRYFSSDDLSSNNFSIMDPIIRLSNGSTYNYSDPHVGFRLRQGTFFSKFMDNIPLDIYRKEALGPNLINGENKVIYYFAFSRYKDYIYMSIKMSEGPYSNNYTTLCRYSVSNEPYNMVLSMIASGSNYAMTYILKDIRIDNVENLPDYIPEINQ